MRIQKLRKDSIPVANVPELCEQAYGWNPNLISIYSKHKLRWKCKNGHVWEQVVAARYKQKLGCPFCWNLKVLAGFNDLFTKYPEIANEAYGWDPTKIVFSSTQIKSWKCHNGHTWSAPISRRTLENKGCKKCSFKNRKANSKIKLIESNPELVKIVGYELAKKYSPSSAKSIELICIKNHNYRTTIRTLVTSGQICSICNGQVFVSGVNDLATEYPEIANEAYGWNPKLVPRRTKAIKSWRCQNGHIYEMSPAQRTQKKIRKKDQSVYYSGCPYCSNSKVLAGFNDLATKYPEIASEAYGWDPTTVQIRTLKDMKWICENKHVYIAKIASRTAGHGCPTCGHGGYDHRKDGYLYLMRHQTFELLQIGISNIPNQRLKFHQKAGWDLLDLIGPLDGLLIREQESAILKYLFKKQIYSPTEDVFGNFSGRTECWYTKELNVLKISELLELVRETEW